MREKKEAERQRETGAELSASCLIDCADSTCMDAWLVGTGRQAHGDSPTLIRLEAEHIHGCPLHCLPARTREGCYLWVLGGDRRRGICCELSIEMCFVHVLG